jgi:predicted Zn-dependent protease
MKRPPPLRTLVTTLLVLCHIVPVLALPWRAWAQGTAAPAIVTIRDAETETLIRSITEPLFRAAGVDPALVRITLIQNRAINAFVTTGNRLFIHTGLIQQASDASELVGVLAHETGHISGGHLARLPEQMRAAMIRSIVAMLLGGAAAAASGRGDAAAAIALGGQAIAMSELYAFTRQQEQAADQAAITLLERNGWSARGLERLLLRLQDQELLSVSRQDPYLRTHPLSRDRLEFVREQLARSRYADAPLPAPITTSFAMVRAKLDGFLESGSIVWRRYPESDRSAPAQYARAIQYFRSGRIDEAARMLDALIREQPASPWLHEMKGQVLFEGGRPREAIAAYRDAVRLAPTQALIRTAYGRALMETGEPALLRQAIEEFEASLRLERDAAFTWRQLGIARGRAGQTALADLALAEEALLNGDYPAARLLAQRAEQALPPGPARLRATDLRNATRRENMTREERELEDRMRREQRERGR